MAIVSDSGPILSFARAGQFELLRIVTPELVIPDAVYLEIAAYESRRPGAHEVATAKWITRRALAIRRIADELPPKRRCQVNCVNSLWFAFISNPRFGGFR